MADVVAPEVHQNDHSYVHGLSGTTFISLGKNLVWLGITRRTSNKHKSDKIPNWGLGACARMGSCLGQYGTGTKLKYEVFITFFPHAWHTLSKLRELINLNFHTPFVNHVITIVGMAS